MIFDCHTHVWEYPAHISDVFFEEAKRAGAGRSIHVDLDEHWEAMQGVERAVVLAFRADQLGVRVPNEYVGDYVSKHPEKLVGFACVDPNARTAADELREALSDPHIRGLKLGPIYQGFHPLDREKAYPVYEVAAEAGVPILFHQGATFVQKGPLEFARPWLIDRIALDFPELKMVVAHLGHPWEHETIVLIRKQPNVYADISALYYRPWQFYSSMRLATEYGVLDKLFFGTDYPFTTVQSTIDGLRSVNSICEGTKLPRIPDDAVEAIVYRDSFEILGL